MDSGTLNWEHKTVVLTNELTQGIEHTKQLRAYLSSVASTSDGTPELLLLKILSSYEKSLLIIKGSEVSVAQSPQPLLPTPGAIESPVSANASPTTCDMNKRSFPGHQEIIDSSKRRKSLPTGTIRVSAVSDDGYSWRKYGQRDILKAKYPRSYYRCTDRWSQGCMATKQVQREDDDTTKFAITYKGSHTCRQTTKLDIHPTEQSNEILLNFRVNANDLDTNPPTSSAGFTDRNHRHFQNSHANYDNLTGGRSPSFESPNTTESSYFSDSSCHMDSSFGIVHSFQHSDSYRTDRGLVLNLYHSESDRTDIFSATLPQLLLPLWAISHIYHLELPPNFPFANYNPIFFSL